MSEEVGLNLDEAVVCYEPEALKGIPIRQLIKDNYDCTSDLICGKYQVKVINLLSI